MLSLNELENELSPSELTELNDLLEDFATFSAKLDEAHRRGPDGVNYIYRGEISYEDEERAAAKKNEVREQIIYFCQELKGK